jgi:tRNA (guanine-N(7)-)-methyltransferase
MSRLKFNRFKAPPPPPSVVAKYLRSYDLKTMYYHPDDLPPILPEDLFGSADPVVFDLGCGRADFLIAQAKAHPDINYVGFDLHWKALWDAINKSNRAGLQNIRFIRTDLRRALLKVPDHAVREAYMLFPPPILAANREKDDLLTESTAREIHRVLVEGASFHFVTDDPDYFELKTAQLPSTGLFEIVSVSQDFEGGLTYFQRVWEKMGIESRRVEFKKRAE